MSKRSVGRPRAEQPRVAPVGFKATEAEYDHVREQALRHGKTVSEGLRSLAAAALLIGYKVEDAALYRDPAPDAVREAHRAAMVARLPVLKGRFCELERRGLASVVRGVWGHDASYIADLPTQVDISLQGSSFALIEDLDVDALVAKVRALDPLDRETVVRAMEFAWSRINKTEPPGVPWPHEIFDRLLYYGVSSVAVK